MNTIVVNERGHIKYIELNRPDVRNAFNSEMISELTQVFLETSSDAELRAVVLSGRGESFSAGADLGWMKSMADFSKKENIEDSQQLFAMFSAAFRCPVPVLGRVHGHVMGGATGLAAICDICVAEKETKFAFSEVLLGLVPAVISPFVLSKMSLASASELMLTGRQFSAHEASASGLIHFVGTETEIESYLEKALSQIRKSGPQAVRETKHLIRQVWQQTEATEGVISKKAVSVIAERRVSDEGQEGLRAFFEKRRPSWSEKESK